MLVFEPDFLPCSFGFRPQRAAHDGLQVLLNESFGRARWVVETDVAVCFGSIPHSVIPKPGRTDSASAGGPSVTNPVGVCTCKLDPPYRVNAFR